MPRGEHLFAEVRPQALGEDHQLAPSLKPVVWAEDGLVEGVEGRDHPWLYGVQWHPERGEAESPADERDPDRRLFWAFIRAAREYARRSAHPEALLASAGD